MQDAIRRLRSQARAVARGKAPTAVRYSMQFRAEALEVARDLQSQGVAVARIARDLGVRPKTLALWLREKGRGRMRRVIVGPGPVAEKPPVQPVLLTPHGVRVEGLDLDAVIHLLRSLA